MTEPSPDAPPAPPAGPTDRTRGPADPIDGPGRRGIDGPNRRGIGRSALVFAIVGVVLALAAGGLYLYRTANHGADQTPDVAVRRFLAQVSLPGDGVPGKDVVCSSWDPASAVAEMTRQVGPELDVSWDNIAVLRQTDTEATVLAELRFYRYGQTRPSGQRRWRFSVVDENGWRVCGASSLTP